jgi:hypothetical protein
VWGRLRDCKRVTCIKCGGRRGHRKSDHMHENGRQFEVRVRVALKDTGHFLLRLATNPDFILDENTFEL